ncbi:OmpA family protein [Oceanicella sp. SM1341]|uniref:OmpA family protein n=1 Tax=Oceanicella sp. SM1341 TaxID=1548889 RepID=UPI000E4B21B3|nr:OmpA family protein [Oceanicella sp. SM1341]
MSLRLRLRGSAAALLMPAFLAPPAALALPVSAPEGAVVTWSDGPREGAFPVPEAPVAAGDTPPAPLEGQVETEVWRFDDTEAEPAALLEGPRAALAGMGYTERYECSALACGGFDFRFALPLVGAPEMEVDLGLYHYVALEMGPERVVLFASRAGSAGYVQVTSVLTTPPPAPATTPGGEGEGTPVPAPVAAAGPGAPPVAATLLAELRRDGRALLPGIDFATGNSGVLPGSAPAIAALAGMLEADPDLQVVIVGHTDATGGLEANLALSRSRAEAIRTLLLRDHGIAAGRVEARGVGPLSPLTNNATDAARARNRRVEIVLQ